MIWVWKILAGLLGGVILALVGGFLVTMSMAGDPEQAGQIGRMFGLGLFVIAIAVALLAPTAGKAWRRIMVCSAVCAFALPLAGLLFSGTLINDVSTSTGPNSDAETIGTAIGGGFVTLVLSVIGIFLGAIFLTIAAFVGKDKKE